MRRAISFLGDPLLRISRKPLQEMKKVAGPLMKSVTKLKGTTIKQRTEGLKTVTKMVGKVTKERMFSQQDPHIIVRNKLTADKNRLWDLEAKIKEQIRSSVDYALSS